MWTTQYFPTNLSVTNIKNQEISDEKRHSFYVSMPLISRNGIPRRARGVWLAGQGVVPPLDGVPTGRLAALGHSTRLQSELSLPSCPCLCHLWVFDMATGDKVHPPFHPQKTSPISSSPSSNPALCHNLWYSQCSDSYSKSLGCSRHWAPYVEQRHRSNCGQMVSDRRGHNCPPHTAHLQPHSHPEQTCLCLSLDQNLFPYTHLYPHRLLFFLLFLLLTQGKSNPKIAS